MLICIAAEQGRVSPHFGHCTDFVLYEIKEGEASHLRAEPNPGHSPGTLPPLLKEWGVTHVIAGGMGPRAVDIFTSFGIDVVTGAEGELEEIARLFVSGELETSGNICHHPHDHGDGSHH